MTLLKCSPGRPRLLVEYMPRFKDNGRIFLTSSGAPPPFLCGCSSLLEAKGDGGGIKKNLSCPRLCVGLEVSTSYGPRIDVSTDAPPAPPGLKRSGLR